MLGWMPALPGALRTGPHHLAPLQGCPDPHHTPALPEFPRERGSLWSGAVLAAVSGLEGCKLRQHPAPHKGGSGWSAMDALTSFPFPSSPCLGGGLTTPDVLCRRNSGGWGGSLCLQSQLGSPALGAFTDGDWRPWGQGELSLSIQVQVPGGKGTCAVAAPATPRAFSYLHPSTSTSQPWQGWGSLTQHLAGSSTPGLSAAPFPTTPAAGGEPTLSFISCPQPAPPRHPAAGCDKGWGLRKHQPWGTQCPFAACACFPALTPPSLLQFRDHRAGCGAEPHLLPLQSPSACQPVRTPPK